MVSCANKSAPNPFDLLPHLPPEGLELDALIKAKVAEADANAAPGIPMKDVFDGLRKRMTEWKQNPS